MIDLEILRDESLGRLAIQFISLISTGLIKEIKTQLVEMPPEKKKRFIEQYDFTDEIAEILKLATIN